MMIIDDVKVVAQDEIRKEEIAAIVAEEKKIWDAEGKTLGEVQLHIDGDEIVIRSFEKSPIKRVRRITGYLSTEEKFNDAKYAELKARVVHF